MGYDFVWWENRRFQYLFTILVLDACTQRAADGRCCIVRDRSPDFLCFHRYFFPTTVPFPTTRRPTATLSLAFSSCPTQNLIIQRGFEVNFWGALARASVRGGVIRTRRVTVLVVVVVLVGATRASRGRIAHHLVLSPTRARQSSRKNSKKKHAQKKR
jgi:hypothetical protein